jgi:uncharacterized protein
MKIGILSDTHLTGITDEFRRVVEKHFSDAEIIFHAGDITGRAVFDYLSNWDLRAVRGNMDDFDLLELLPGKRVEEVMGLKIGIIHGRGAPQGIEDLVLSEFTDVDFIVFGHSHVPLIQKKNSVMLFNPGSFSGRYSYRGTVGIMEIGESVTFRHVEV